MDEGGFILDYLMPAGSSLADTNEVLLGVEKILESNAGSGEHFAAHRLCNWAWPRLPKLNQGDFSVRLKRRSAAVASMKLFPRCARR